MGLARICPRFHKAIGAYRETPLRLAKSRLTAVARLHGACGRTSQAPWACQLSFALSGCTPSRTATPAKPFRGAFLAAPLWGWCSAPLLPPLGEVPRSGKGGAVGIFEPLPFIEQHPLSQPCRFRSAVKSASSPNGGAKVGLARICPRFHKAIGAYCETPLRLAKSRLAAVARLHGACGRTSQAQRACQLPFQGRFSCCPLWGKCREAAKGVPLVFLSRCHSSNNTPSVSLAGSEVPSSLPAPPTGEPRGLTPPSP